MSDLNADLASLRIQRVEDPNRPRRGRSLLVSLAAIAAVVGVGAVTLPSLGAKIFKTEVVLTEVSLVSPAQASITVTSTGYVVAQTSSKVGSKIAGRLAKVLVREGDTVKAGDVLAELDASDQRSTIAAAGSRAAAASARVATARANLVEVERQVERNRILVDRGALARATLEDLENREKALEQQVAAAEAEAKASSAEIGPMRVGLQDRTMLAPISGTIVTKPLQIGELVGPQSTIAEIADFSSMLVETDVPEGRLFQIKVGTPTEIALDAYPGKRYRGETVQIGRKVDRAKATVKVKVKFIDAMEGVLPDMASRTSFLAQALSDAQVREAPKRIVPANAIVDRDGQKLVFVAEEGVVRRHVIKLGAPFGGGFELVEGPSPGARVVANPPQELTEGQRIKEKGSS